MTRWIRHALAADPPRAKSLIVTVWGDALAPHGGAVWLAGLIRLMAPFAINDRLVRTSVFRLVHDGWLARATHGRASRYRLTRDGARRFDDAHRRIYERPADDWHGQWELVLADAVPAVRRSALREELAWAGFGELGPTAFLRPSERGERCRRCSPHRSCSATPWSRSPTCPAAGRLPKSSAAPGTWRPCPPTTGDFSRASAR